MKDLTINKSRKDKDLINTTNEDLNFALDALENSKNDNQDFQIDESYIIEYDLTEKKDPIYWMIDRVDEVNGFVKSINIGC